MESSPPTASDNSNGDEREFEFSEDSLDVVMEEGEQGESGDRHGVNGVEQDVQEPVTRTLAEVMNMEFESPEDAVRFYEQYSRGKGFSMRQGRKLKTKRGEVVRYTFLCNREGFRSKKWLEMPDRKREHKAVTRCGCRAEMRIRPKGDTGRWYVSRFVDEHNHELLPAKFMEHLPSSRKISNVDVAHMDSPRQVGISVPNINESIAAQAGGFNDVPLTKRDMYNVVRCQRTSRNGDVNATLKFLESCAMSDEKMFWRFRTSPEQHSCDLFWSDGCSQEDYSIFGDVLAFDATYGRNKYNLPVIVFSGVNHHNETCVFGAAVVSCESQGSYVWVLRQFLECMGGKSPRTVITDGDRSMRLAIQEVFPEACHRLCSGQLLKNATVNICKPRFTTLLKNCMLADIEVEEFEMQWQAMVDECGVREVEWVKDLYEKKSLWATAYIRGCFYAGLRTTSRCELLHAKLGKFVERRYGVLEFVTNFQRCVDFLRDNEDELDFRSYSGTPVMQTEFPELEESGAAEYTREIFLHFRETLKSSVRITILECNQMGERDVYVTQKYRKPDKRWSVEHVKEGDCFHCSCMRMESFGLPCVHILAVLVRLDMCSLPKSLILQRWSKNAKVDIFLGGGSRGDEEVDSSHVYKSRVGAFLQLCKRFAKLACTDETDYKNCSAKVVEEIKILEQKNTVARNEGCNWEQFDEGVGDPIGVRTNGTVPVKSSQESMGISVSQAKDRRSKRSRTSKTTVNNNLDVQLSQTVEPASVGAARGSYYPTGICQM